MEVCKGRPQPECRLPHCVHVETKKRRYCRKANNTKRVKTVRVTPTSAMKRDATKKIVRFIQQSKPFLQLVCNGSNECLSLGRHTNEIENFFNHFSDFEYVGGELKSVGSVSGNGFIREIRYVRDGYTAYAILKSNTEIDSDNLVYEYLVGTKFINVMNKQYPCFLSTYGLMYYKDHDVYTTMKNDFLSIHQVRDFLQNSLELQTSIDYKKACLYSRFFAILIQHIHNSTTFFDALQDGGDFIKHHMTHVLFILYHALASLSKVFTHYDLHRTNVLLLRPYPGKTIQYVYHQKDGTTLSFKCPYIPKIIDYGRCFFNTGAINSKQIYDKVCAVPECGRCGEEYGFTWLSPTPSLAISSQQKNESHDLKLIYELDKIMPYVNFKAKMRVSHYSKFKSYRMVEKMLKRVKYGESIQESQKMHGTEEDTTLHPKGDIVANVTDAYHELKKIVTHKKVIEENNIHQPDTMVAGTLHIYEDGRHMEFFRA
jgi:hypothetical protein